MQPDYHQQEKNSSPDKEIPLAVKFHSEDQIAKTVKASEWASTCGHDCCTCDRER